MYNKTRRNWKGMANNFSWITLRQHRISNKWHFAAFFYLLFYRYSGVRLCNQFLYPSDLY